MARLRNKDVRGLAQKRDDGGSGLLKPCHEHEVACTEMVSRPGA